MILNQKYIVRTVLLSCMFFLDVNTSVAQENSSHKLGSKIKTIYIDPAYGGKEHGPKFGQKTYGKDITLLIAQKLQGLLTKVGFDVYLSREGDQFIPPETRTFQSKSKRADVYLAINVSNRKKDCIRLLFADLTKERKPIQHIKTKKLSELNSELDEIIKGLKEDERIEESLYLVQKLETNLQSDQRANCIKIQKDYDYILLNAEMPALIVDFGISKQSHGSPYILNTGIQNKILIEIAAAIKAYAEERSPEPNP